MVGFQHKDIVGNRGGKPRGIAAEEIHFDMGVMVTPGLFSFGQCTPRCGSAYLLHVHSLMPDNMSLQAAASCVPACVCLILKSRCGPHNPSMWFFNWFAWLVALPHSLSRSPKTNATPSLTPLWLVRQSAQTLGRIKEKNEKGVAVANERTAWHPHEVSGQSSSLWARRAGPSGLNAVVQSSISACWPWGQLTKWKRILGRLFSIIIVHHRSSVGCNNMVLGYCAPPEED